VINECTSLEQLISVYGGEECFKNIKLITLAPEIEGMMDLIPEIKKKNIIISAGKFLKNLLNRFLYIYMRTFNGFYTTSRKCR
jgi:hypothetical protein